MVSAFLTGSRVMSYSETTLSNEVFNPRGHLGKAHSYTPVMSSHDPGNEIFAQMLNELKLAI